MERSKNNRWSYYVHVPKKIYAIYKGEKLEHIGTLEELSKTLNIKKSTLHFYHSNAYKKILDNRKTRNARVMVCIGLVGEDE